MSEVSTISAADLGRYSKAALAKALQGIGQAEASRLPAAVQVHLERLPEYEAEAQIERLTERIERNATSSQQATRRLMELAAERERLKRG